MKKNLLLTVAAFAAAISCTFGFAACDFGSNETGKTPPSISSPDGTNPDGDGSSTTPPEEEIPAPHEHASQKWLFDENSHWKVCDGCSEKFGEEYHDSSEDCEICGYIYTTDGLAYELNDDETSYTVTGIGEATDGKIKIPAEYNGLPVTSIAVRAFSQCTRIISIVIPDSVTEIGSQAFYECSNLQSVVLPKNLTTIGTYLFYSCTALKSVTVPVAVTEIGERAFAFCSKLQTISYGGTASQWTLITKPSNWKQSSTTFSVVCSDETISAADA